MLFALFPPGKRVASPPVYEMFIPAAT